jgi:hypothetical protein
MSVCLHGSVFTEPLPRRGLHNRVVPLLVLVSQKRLFLWLNRSCMGQIRHNICLLSNAKIYHYYMNLLLLYVGMSSSYLDE